MKPLMDHQPSRQFLCGTPLDCNVEEEEEEERLQQQQQQQQEAEATAKSKEEEEQQQAEEEEQEEDQEEEQETEQDDAHAEADLFLQLSNGHPTLQISCRLLRVCPIVSPIAASHLSSSALDQVAEVAQRQEDNPVRKSKTLPAPWKYATRTIGEGDIPSIAAAEIGSGKLNRLQTCLGMGEDVKTCVIAVWARNGTPERTMARVIAWRMKSCITKKRYIGNTEKAIKVCKHLEDKRLKKGGQTLARKDEDVFYWIVVGSKMAYAHKTSEELPGVWTLSLDGAQASDIFSQGGRLGSGMHFAIHGMSEKDATSVFVSMEEGAGDKAKKAVP